MGAHGPLPPIDGPEQPFWDGLRSGRVVVQRCAQCGIHRFPAASHCPSCHAAGAAWVTVPGKGVVESWCTFHRAYFPELPTPYTVVQVKLACGVRLFSNLVGAPAGMIRMGLPVTAVFEPASPDVTLLKFKPAAERRRKSA